MRGKIGEWATCLFFCASAICQAATIELIFGEQ
jgi:hypothetical protein